MSNEQGAVPYRSLQGEIAVLSLSEEVNILVDQAPPAGCAVTVVNQGCEVFLLLSGMIDPEAELARLEKNKAKLLADQTGLQKRMSVPTYDKVPKDVQEKNKQQAIAINEELNRIAEAMKTFESLRTKKP